MSILVLVHTVCTYARLMCAHVRLRDLVAEEWMAPGSPQEETKKPAPTQNTHSQSTLSTTANQQAT